jgi:hypothetical protein
MLVQGLSKRECASWVQAWGRQVIYAAGSSLRFELVAVPAPRHSLGFNGVHLTFLVDSMLGWPADLFKVCCQPLTYVHHRVYFRRRGVIDNLPARILIESSPLKGACNDIARHLVWLAPLVARTGKFG